jgi:ABC-type dipeptide/oligopeptide/nickel transport system permease subunit
MVGLAVLTLLVTLCVGSLYWTLYPAEGRPTAMYADGVLDLALLPPSWIPLDPDDPSDAEIIKRVDAYKATDYSPTAPGPDFLLGSDNQGRSVLIRALTGGGVSIGIGISAAAISVFIGTLYGSIAGFVGGKIDAAMMRIVDILYGLPYILLVVLLAVAGSALIDKYDNNLIERRAVNREAWIITQGLEQLDESGIKFSTAAIAPSTAELWNPEREPAATPSDKRTIEQFLASPNPQGVPGVADALSKVDPGLTTLRELRQAVLDDLPDDGAAILSDANSQDRLQVRGLRAGTKNTLAVGILLVAIGGVSWLTMARVIRGQVLSLKSQPFMEAARAMGTPVTDQFRRHLLPNLLGPIIVYATLTVPQAILQESFLSFLGIGVAPPLPSWGNLAAEGLNELNTTESRWWLLAFPCVLLGVTLLALNFVGEGLREAFDPKRARK